MNYYSFDIYDTLITRSFVEPKDLFAYIEIKYEIHGFSRARIQAEEKARLASSSGEVNLDEIYEHLDGLRAGKNQLDEIKQKELDEEFLSYQPIRHNIRRLQQLDCRSDSFVLFISDMYLPAEFIKKVLRKFGVWSEEKLLFISGHHRCNKHSGKLFDLVKSTVNFDPGKDTFTHIGDNKHSDFLMANKSGIKGEHYCQGSANIYEQSSSVDSSIYAKFAQGVSRQIRLSRERQYTNPSHLVIYETSLNVAGPIVLGFVLFCLDQAKKFGIKKLFFCSRDGQILYKVAKLVVAKYYLGQIDVEYLYVSRQALLLPSIDKLSDLEFEWILAKTSRLTLDIICKRVGLESSDHVHALKRFGFHGKIDDQLSETDLTTIRSYFVSIENLILSIAREKKLLLQGYMEQLGMFGENKFGMVDVGWSGTLQRSLSRVIRDVNQSFDSSYGFYFGVARKKVEPTDHMLGWFFDLEYQPELIRNNYLIPLIELFFAADHGGVIDYKIHDNQYIPRLRYEENERALRWGLGAQQDAIVDFCTNMIQLTNKLNTDSLGQQLKHISVRNLEILFENPSPAEARAYGEYEDAEDQNESYFLKLASPYDFHELKLVYIENYKHHHNEWQHAALVRSGPCAQFAKRYVSGFA